MSELKDSFIADLDQLLQLEGEFAKLKAAYATYDEVIGRLRAQGFVTAEHAGRTFTLVDNFADKNTAFRMSFIKRFEVKIK